MSNDREISRSCDCCFKTFSASAGEFGVRYCPECISRRQQDLDDARRSGGLQLKALEQQVETHEQRLENHAAYMREIRNVQEHREHVEQLLSELVAAIRGGR